MALLSLLRKLIKEDRVLRMGEAILLKLKYKYIRFCNTKQLLIYHLRDHCVPLYHEYSNCKIWFILWRLTHYQHSSSLCPVWKTLYSYKGV